MKDNNLNTKGATFSGMFTFQEGIYHHALDNLKKEDALKRPTEHSNHINWLLGHILHCRFMLANMLGIKAENPFGNTYWTAIENKDYPGLNDLVTQFPGISSLLVERLAGMSNEQLDATPAKGQPSLAEMVAFFIYHEAYHIGQIGYARKAIGLGAMKSN